MVQAGEGIGKSTVSFFDTECGFSLSPPPNHYVFVLCRSMGSTVLGVCQQPTLMCTVEREDRSFGACPSLSSEPSLIISVCGLHLACKHNSVGLSAQAACDCCVDTIRNVCLWGTVSPSWPLKSPLRGEEEEGGSMLSCLPDPKEGNYRRGRVVETTEATTTVGQHFA